jgi:glutamate decarboxylase
MRCHELLNHQTRMQVCWEKFARYFEVELKEVKLKEGYYVMDPEKAAEMVDENTICVAAILGSTLNGEFEDVKLLSDLLTAKNAETGWVRHLINSRFLRPN